MPEGEGATIVEIAELGGTAAHREAAYEALRDGTSLEDFKAKLKSVQFQEANIAGRAIEQSSHGEKYNLSGVADYLAGDNRGKTAQQDIASVTVMSDQLKNRQPLMVNGKAKYIPIPASEEMETLMSGGAGIIIPHAVMSGEATLVASTNVSGEIAIEVDESRYLDWLVEPSKFLTHCDVLRDATSDFKIPIGSGSGPQVTYLAENTDTITDTSATWKTVSPTPNAMLATMPYTELSNIRTQGFVGRRLSEGFGAALANKVDNSVIAGSGVAPIPRGLDATTGSPNIKAHSYATADGITWEDIVAIEGSVKRDGPFRNYLFAVSKQVYGMLRVVVRAAGQGGFIINDVNEELMTGAIDGTPVISSEHVPDNELFYGPFNQIVVPFWGFLVAGSFREQSNPLRNRVFVLQYHDVTVKRNDLFNHTTRT